MLFKRNLLILFWVFLPALGFAAFKQQDLPLKSYAAPGDAGIGEIITENDERLELNVTPCSPTKVTVIFQKPFAKESTKGTSCNGVAKAQVQVIQK
jgi:hypothetical protein